MRVGILMLLAYSLAQANGNWTKTVAALDCGHSEEEARRKARAVVQNEINFLESVCTGAAGTFSVEFKAGNCTKEPQEFTCPITCTVSAKATCIFLSDL